MVVLLDSLVSYRRGITIYRFTVGGKRCAGARGAHCPVLRRPPPRPPLRVLASARSIVNAHVDSSGLSTSAGAIDLGAGGAAQGVRRRGCGAGGAAQGVRRSGRRRAPAGGADWGAG